MNDNKHKPDAATSKVKKNVRSSYKKGLETIYENVAGIDIGSSLIHVAILNEKGESMIGAGPCVDRGRALIGAGPCVTA